MALAGPALHFRESDHPRNRNRPFVVGDTPIFQGGACGMDTDGTVVPVSAGTFPFIGFAAETGVTGDIVQIQRGGLFLIPLAGADITDTDAIVYATADDAFTLTSTGAVQVGRLWRPSLEDVAPSGYVWLDSGSDWHDIS